MASATTVSAAAMVMTNSGSTLPAAHWSAPAACVVTSEHQAPAEYELDADEEQDSVAPHRDPEDAQADQGGGEQVGAREVDHGATSCSAGSPGSAGWTGWTGSGRDAPRAGCATPRAPRPRPPAAAARAARRATPRCRTAGRRPGSRRRRRARPARRPVAAAPSPAAARQRPRAGPPRRFATGRRRARGRARSGPG